MSDVDIADKIWNEPIINKSSHETMKKPCPYVRIEMSIFIGESDNIEKAIHAHFDGMPENISCGKQMVPTHIIKENVLNKILSFNISSSYELIADLVLDNPKIINTNYSKERIAYARYQVTRKKEKAIIEAEEESVISKESVKTLYDYLKYYANR